MPGTIPATARAWAKGGTVGRVLADGLVVQDGPADALAEPGGGHDHLAVGPSGPLGLGDAYGGEPAVTSRVALVHRQ